MCKCVCVCEGVQPILHLSIRLWRVHTEFICYGYSGSSTSFSPSLLHAGQIKTPSEILLFFIQLWEKVSKQWVNKRPAAAFSMIKEEINNNYAFNSFLDMGRVFRYWLFKSLKFSLNTFLRSAKEEETKWPDYFPGFRVTLTFPSPACCCTLPVSWLKERNYTFHSLTKKQIF